MTEKTGGYRVGSGRPSQWRSPTKMIRLPAHLEADLVALAHKLDEGGSKPLTMDELQLMIASVLLSIPPRDRRSANRLFKKLLGRLGNK